MTRVLIPRSDNISAKPINPSDFEKYFECHLPDHIICGMVVQAQCPNTNAVNITAGNARFKGLHLNNSTTCTVTGLSNATHKIYAQICRDACSEADEYTFGSTTGAIGACQFHIADVVVGGGTVCSVSVKAITASSCNIRFTYNMTTAQRTCVSWWRAGDLVFDTCTNLVYNNTHACAPTSVTWSVTGGWERAASWTACPTAGDMLFNTTTCQLGIYKQADPLIWTDTGGNVIYFRDEFTSYTACNFGTYYKVRHTGGGAGFTLDATCNEIDFIEPGQGNKSMVTRHLGGIMSNQWVMRFRIDIDTFLDGTCFNYLGVGLSTTPDKTNWCSGSDAWYGRGGIGFWALANGGANTENFGIDEYQSPITGISEWSGGSTNITTTATTGTKYVEISYNMGIITGKVFTCACFSSQQGSTASESLSDSSGAMQLDTFTLGISENGASSGQIRGSLVWWEFHNGTTVVGT
jgi:hypothetical protein